MDGQGRHAVFEELSSAPAAMPAGKFADAYGCMPGRCLQTAEIGKKTLFKARPMTEFASISVPDSPETGKDVDVKKEEANLVTPDDDDDSAIGAEDLCIADEKDQNVLEEMSKAKEEN